jgi:hypothetical protein
MDPDPIREAQKHVDPDSDPDPEHWPEVSTVCFVLQKFLVLGSSWGMIHLLDAMGNSLPSRQRQPHTGAAELLGLLHPLERDWVTRWNSNILTKLYISVCRSCYFLL